MQLKIKKNLRFGETFREIKEEFSKKENANAFKTLLQETIYNGISPVAGKKFKNYSESYSKLKGKKSPVDMTVTGDMLDSLRVESKNGSLIVEFTDEKAKYHDIDGVGKNKIVRRLLPRQGAERFRSDIVKILKDFVTKAIDKVTKKQNN
jgi:hypothetical protein